MSIVPKVLELLREAGRGDVVTMVGGIIPDGDSEILLANGVARVFTPGASLTDIGSWLEQTLDASATQ